MTSVSSYHDYLFELSDEDLAAVMACLDTLDSKLVPRCKELDVAARRGMVKVGPKSVDFVDKTLGYMRANPQWVPGYADVDALEKSWRAVEILRAIEQRLDRVRNVVNDTNLYSGSVTYDGTLGGYQNFKAAAKRNQVGAEIIVADLAPRFAAQGRVRKPVLPQGTSDAQSK